MKPPTKCGRVHFEHRHRKWSVITVRPTTSVRKSPRKNLPSRNTPDSFCRLLHPTKSIAALRGRYFSFMVTCRGGGPSILLTQDRSVAQKPHWGFCCYANASLPWQAEQAHHAPSNEKQSVSDCWVSVKQFSKNDTATACQDWLRSTRLGRGSIKSHVRTVKVLGMGLFAFQERVHLLKGVTH